MNFLNGRENVDGRVYEEQRYNEVIARSAWSRFIWWIMDFQKIFLY